MEDGQKSKDQLIAELAELRLRIEELQRKYEDHQLALKIVKESEEFFRNIVENSPDLVAIIDVNGRIVTANHQFRESFGYQDLRDIARRNIFEFILPEEVERAREDYALLKKKGIVRNLEYHVLKGDGTYVPVEFSASKMTDAEGNAIGFFAIARDITKRKMLEKALRESEERYRELVENQGEGISFVDGEENFVFANPASEEIFGVPPGTLPGRNLREFTDESTFKMIREQTRARMSGKKSTYEIKIIRPDGEKRWIRLTAMPRFDENGSFTGAFGVFSDITQRKFMEEALKESEEKYRAFIQSASDAIISCDSEGIIISWNKGARDIFGYEEEEALGRSIRMLMPEEKMESYIETLRSSISGSGETLAGRLIETYGRRKDGSIFPLELSSASWETARGTFYTGIIRDITQRKIMEQELRLANRELNAYAHTVSHDLRSPIATIEGYAQLATKACEEGDRELEKKSLETIRRLTGRAIHLIDSLLEYAKSGKLEGEMTEVNPGEIIAETLMEYNESIHNSGVEVTVKERFPNVIADPVKLHQVFSNLLGNALKFMGDNPHPQVEIDWETREGMLEVSVRDNGIGIHPDLKEKIFEPFRRFNHKRDPGLGIGLSTVKRAVEAWGGSIWMESAPGRGSSFFFTIPLAKSL